jgi:hypothetical protein
MDHPPLNHQELDKEVKIGNAVRFFRRSFQQKPEDKRPPWNLSTNAKLNQAISTQNLNWKKSESISGPHQKLNNGNSNNHQCH